MTLKSSSKRRKKQRKTSRSSLKQNSNESLEESPPNNLEYTVKLTKEAYQDREQVCSYKDYLALITLANFNEHEIKHLPLDKFRTNTQIEMELLKRWNKLPLEERNKYENEAIDNDIFHQIAYTRIYSDPSFNDKFADAHRLSVRKELELQWNQLPDEEKIVHKRVITNRDIDIKRRF